VKKGDAITQGQIIAKVGKTGRATGPHLDWRMNWFEERVDPQLLVAPMSKE
jgi:murein DD-endopeptidase MepM/ murein hydrolase activator NlpD